MPWTFFFSLFLLLLSACPRPEADPTKADLTQYIETARSWAKTELQINAAIAKVREDQFVHDDLVISTLRPIVDVSQKYVQQLESHHPRTPPLRNVHLEYIEAWRAHYLAFSGMIDAVEKKDYIQLAKANDELLAAQNALADALTDLSRLMQETGLRSAPPSNQQSRPSAPSPGGPASQMAPKGM
ncbi:MAG: hypothetical protein HOP18_18975 [Deltaproteobacteria bacterium]|nr:hypothetical protein [Deltaproteobacteria bacterium]